MPSLAVTGRTVAAAVTVAGLASGCAVSAASTPAPPAPSAALASATSATVPSVAPIDRLTEVARRRYAMEVHGGVVIGTARRVARDPTLLGTVQSADGAATRAYIRRRFPAVWYHWHVSRLRVRKGSAVVAETGVPFVVAPTQVTLRSSGGRTVGTLEVSVQDVIGFVRFMHRNYPVDVVVRGKGAAHIRTSLPGAEHANLPSRGPVTIAGRRYLARSFHETAWNREPVTVWILTKA
jgi:hypothetical protein